ncbi:MAG: hypothetical protein CVU89_10375 [Firmicutes bacterium HGW-Firmicutes-14]|nr:MAG: hypothetical protein CVU89_10375 [Firmicutes bacterium HGW-Firmicutes-14]
MTEVFNMVFEKPVKFNLLKFVLAGVVLTLLLVGGCAFSRSGGSGGNAGDKGNPAINPRPDKGSEDQDKSSTGSGNLRFVREIDLLKEGLHIDSLDYAADGGALISPDSRKVALSGFKYSADEGTEPESRLAVADLTTGKVQVVDTGPFIRVLEWSPSSGKILYRKFESLYVADINGNSPLEISGSSYHGSFSPDGKMIAYSERDNGIFTVKADGNDKKQVTFKKGDWYPVWYPDGKNLFYFADRDVNLGDGAGQLQGLGRVNLETGNREDILSDETGKYRRASWVVPGKVLHINKGWDDGYFEIMVNLETGKITDLGENSENNYSTAIDRANGLVYKADSKRVVALDGSGNEVSSFPFDKPVDDRFLTNFGYSVSPDGRLLAYLFGEKGSYADSNIKGRKVWVVKYDGTGTTELTADYGDFTTPVWTRGSSHLVTTEQKGGQESKFVIRVTPVPSS